MPRSGLAAARPWRSRNSTVGATRTWCARAQSRAVVTLPFSWAEDDAWKDALAASHADDRRPRDPEPQYQDETDRARAEAALAAGGCPGCVFLDER